MILSFHFPTGSLSKKYFLKVKRSVFETDAEKKRFPRMIGRNTIWKSGNN
jgi:CRISPR/Cas system-associated endoribonuclease Cas2